MTLVVGNKEVKTGKRTAGACDVVMHSSIVISGQHITRLIGYRNFAEQSLAVCWTNVLMLLNARLLT